MWSREGSPLFYFEKMLKFQESCKTMIPNSHTPEGGADLGLVREPHRNVFFSSWWCWFTNIRFSVDRNTALPATQPREKPLFLSYLYPSVNNPVIVTINIFPRIQVLLTSSSATVLVQVAIISHLDHCSRLLAGCPAFPVASIQPLPTQQPEWSCRNVSSCLPLVRPLQWFPDFLSERKPLTVVYRVLCSLIPFLCLWPHFLLLSPLLFLLQSHLPPWTPRTFVLGDFFYV